MLNTLNNDTFTVSCKYFEQKEFQGSSTSLSTRIYPGQRQRQTYPLNRQSISQTTTINVKNYNFNI